MRRRKNFVPKCTRRCRRLSSEVAAKRMQSAPVEKRGKVVSVAAAADVSEEVKLEVEKSSTIPFFFFSFSSPPTADGATPKSFDKKRSSANMLGAL